MKNSVEEFKCRFEQAEERTSKLEDRIIEIKSEEQKKKTKKKSEENCTELKGSVGPSNRPIYTLWKSQKKRETERGQRECL